MATPANRVPVRIARGSKANLDTAIAAGDLKEGEICYATDENGIYVVEGGVLTQAGADLASTSIDGLSDVDTTTAAPVDGQALIWNNSASQWEPGGVSGEIEWTLTANGTADYIFSGAGFAGTETDPAIYVMRGQTYKFTNGMGAHPFQIQSTQGTGGTAYNDGITNNAVSNGTLTWEVRMDAPSTLYYQCTSHADMNGTIYVLDTVTSINDLGDVDTATAAPTDGQVLTWVAANSQWEPAPSSGAVSSVNGQTGVVSLEVGDLTDVEGITGGSAAILWDDYNSSLGANGRWYVSGNQLQFNKYDDQFVDQSATIDASPASGALLISQDGTNYSQYEYTSYQNGASADWRYFDLVDASGITQSGNIYIKFGATGPSDGQVLTWVDANSSWEPVSSQIATASDVSIPADNPAASLLLHGNGADAGTTYTDSSSNGYALSSYESGTTTSTAQVKYGSASLLFTGTSSIQVTSTTDSEAVAEFLGNDFTIEFWAYPTVADSQAGCVSYGITDTISASFFINLDTSSGNESLKFWYHDGTSSTFVNGPTAKTLLNTWTHFAVTRQGSYLRGFVDGVEVFSETISVDLDTTTQTLKFGKGNSGYITGHMDDIRIINGTAAYTAAFTPPAAELSPTAASGIADGQVLTWVDANSQW